MKKLTDDEIMAKALLCPESKKVPLEVGDRVIALEDFEFIRVRINHDFVVPVKKGDKGTMCAWSGLGIWPILINWGSAGLSWGILGPIGKLVKRGSV